VYRVQFTWKLNSRVRQRECITFPAYFSSDSAMAYYNGYTNKTVIDRYLRLPQSNKVRERTYEAYRQSQTFVAGAMHVRVD